MNWADLGLRKKLALPIALVGILLLLVSYVLISTLEQISSDYSFINREYIPAVQLVLNADRDLYQAQIAERTIALGQPSQAREQAHQENIQQVEDRLKQILNMEVRPKAKELAQKFLTEFTAWRPNSNDIVADAMAGNAASAAERSMGSARDEFEAMRGTLDQLGELLGQEAEALQAEATVIKNEAVVEATILVIIALGVTLAIAILFPRIIVKPISKLTRVLRELASGKGDLTIVIPVMGKDEIGTLSNTFNEFLQGLRELIRETQGVSAEVKSASQHLTSGVRDTKEVSDKYAASMDMVATANQEMGSAIQEVSSNSQEVSNQAKNADGMVRQVAADYGQAMNEIADLVDNVNHSAEVIKKLETETANIESVLDVIKAIAEQTNLLALNAAIEAARAGEQGRGFAVVADEVRTLASRTQESTGDINNMIETLRSGVSQAVTSMTQGQEKAEQTVAKAKQSQHDFDQVSEVLVSITDSIMQVASAIEEQTSVIDEINSNLHGAKELSERGQESTELIASSVDNLSDQASVLNDRTGSFKVD
ncbi:methyl-accepting chemotaxis protein [Bermanella sp. R86510]|uniref:methyl-accepting chemotaxis protein n=1 Tax=unclassified Bermanella TaxID=2627862 RepID=UPI0037CAD83F